MAISQNGWPVVMGGSSSTLVRTDKIIGKVRGGDVEKIFRDLISQIDTYVEDVDRGADDWGWNVRPIRGQVSGYSNHASGTAIDLNAMLHPRGKINTFSASQQKAIRSMLRSRYKGAIRWGGDYNLKIAKRDDMHFEIDCSAAQLSRVVAGLSGAAKPAGSVKPPAKKPNPKPTLVKENSGNSKAENIAIAKMLNALGYDAGAPDGVPGTYLRAGVLQYQKSQKYAPGLKRDGDWGPAWQKHYDWVKGLQDHCDDWNASQRLGWLAEDGDYAAVTAKHVKAIQSSNMKPGLPYYKAGGRAADGEAGPIFCKSIGYKKHPFA